jgi:hypothetical protein
MPSSSIIIISGGGGTRATLSPGVQYTLLAGEGVKNTEPLGGPSADVIFTGNGKTPVTWTIAPQQTTTTLVDGYVELP